jgi:hypothetical protein
LRFKSLHLSETLAGKDELNLKTAIGLGPSCTSVIGDVEIKPRSTLVVEEAEHSAPHLDDRNII